MRIFGFGVGRSRKSIRRLKTLTGKGEQIVNATLLSAAIKDPGVMAAVIGKYCHNWVQLDNRRETEKIIEELRAKIHKDVEQTIRNERSHELATRVADITGRVIHGGTDHTGRNDKEKYPEGGITHGEDGTQATGRQPRRLQRDMKDNSTSPAIMEGLEVLAALATLARWQIKMKARGRSENMNGVDHSGYASETSENGYERYSRRPRGLKQHEGTGSRFSRARKPGLPGISKPSRAQQNKE